jgi:hypothetical protein
MIFDETFCGFLQARPGWRGISLAFSPLLLDLAGIKATGRSRESNHRRSYPNCCSVAGRRLSIPDLSVSGGQFFPP